MTPDDPEGRGVDELLRRAGELPAPPPAADLLRKVGEQRSVRTRSRLGGFAIAALAAVVWPIVILTQSPMRPDLGALPRAWLVGGSLLWGLGALATLAAALVPPRGDVLPSGPRAVRVALASMLALLVFAMFGTASVPGQSLGLAQAHVTLLESSFKCGSYVFLAAVVVLATGALVLRRVLPVGGRRLGMALGAAGGAAGGLALHFVCPLSVTAHVIVGHVGAVVLAAVAGAALFWALFDR
jgi:hypothetical protein